MRQNILVYLLSVHSFLDLSRSERMDLMRLRFERYFSHYWVTKKFRRILDKNNIDAFIYKQQFYK